MFCPPKLSGSMPAGQARPRLTRGEIPLPPAMPIITKQSVRRPMLASTVPTPGAFLICTGMCGSGLPIGMDLCK